RLEDLERFLAPSQCLVLGLADETPDLETGSRLKECFPRRLWLAVELFADGRDRVVLHRRRDAAARLDLPLVASGDVHMHCRERRMLQDTLTAVRLKTPVQKLGFALHPNGERCLRSIEELSRR